MLLTESKSVRRAAGALARGGRLDGKRGTATPSADKAAKYLGCMWHLLGQSSLHWQHRSNAAGQLVFMMQFQRPAFFGLTGLWSAMEYGLDGRRRWALAANDLVHAAAVFPLACISFRTR